MSTAEDIIRVAQGQIGYHEGSNNDNKYGAWWGMNHAAWCDIFTTWVFHLAGCPRPSEQIPGREGSASVNYTVNYWRAKGLFRPSTQSQPGDLICYDWTGHENGSNWAQTHIGIVVGRNGSRIDTIEGNRGDRVARHVQTAGEQVIWGTCNMQALIASGKGGGKPPAPLPPPPPMPPGVPQYLMALVLSTPPMHNQHVLLWQDKMHARGWRIAVDGVYGPASMATCRAFQRDKRLEIDGVVGPKTWIATWTSQIT